MTAPKCLNVALDNCHSAVVWAMWDANGDPRPRSANGIPAMALTLDHAGALFFALSRVEFSVRVFAKDGHDSLGPREMVEHFLETGTGDGCGHLPGQAHCQRYLAKRGAMSSRDTDSRMY